MPTRFHLIFFWNPGTGASVEASDRKLLGTHPGQEASDQSCETSSAREAGVETDVWWLYYHHCTAFCGKFLGMIVMLWFSWHGATLMPYWILEDATIQPQPQTSSGTTCFVSASRNPWSLLADLNFEFRSTEDCEDWTTWLSSDQGHGLWNFWNSNEIPRMGAGYNAMSLSLLVLTCVRLIPLIPLFENQKSDCNAVFAKSSLHFARSAVRVSLGYTICKFWVPTMFSLIWSALKYTL